ncbi:MAG: ribosomal protein S18-alanine N-acetyltransferase [Candidatus Bathyarchaeia archaeon]
MKNLRIRPASPADLPGICLIEDNSFSDPYPRYLLERLLEEIGKVFLVAEEASDKLVGYCVSSLEGRMAHLISIAVLTKSRRKGVATSLVRDLIEYLEARRVDELWLEVKQGNKEAIKLYEKFGFAKVMILENYYSDGSPALRMRMSLRKQVLKVERNQR